LVSNPDPPGRIVVVDDDPTVADVVGRYLVRDGHTVECVHDGYEALRRVAEEPPDLVVLDLMLPGMDGLEVCRRLRARWPIPVVMLTALGDETDRLIGFETGADDYVTKPFSTIELKARVRALLRRSAVSGSNGMTTIKCGDLKMDLEARTLTRDGALVHLTPIEWELLRSLMTHAGKTMTHRQLFSAVWPGRAYGDAQQYLRVHVANVRRKVEPDPLSPRYIFTEPGVGYRFASCE
jgi:DNA-binding response OmpR family regulator